MFNTSEISQLLKACAETGFEEIDLQIGDLHIQLGSGTADADTPRQVASSGPEPRVSENVPEDNTNAVEVRSATVGTFYAAPSPGADPFVKEGDRVTATQQVGLVEVMKLFNAVEAGVDGTVVAIKARDGALVEFDEVLMTIRPDTP